MHLSIVYRCLESPGMAVAADGKSGVAELKKREVHEAAM
jgi:hypothetical protein